MIDGAMYFCDGPDAGPLPSRPDPRYSDWGDWRCVCCDPPRAYCQDCGASLDENDRCTRVDA